MIAVVEVAGEFGGESDDEDMVIEQVIEREKRQGGCSYITSGKIKRGFWSLDTVVDFVV